MKKLGRLSFVMPGPVPGIPVLRVAAGKARMARTIPAMTH